MRDDFSRAKFMFLHSLGRKESVAHVGSRPILLKNSIFELSCLGRCRNGDEFRLELRLFLLSLVALTALMQVLNKRHFVYRVQATLPFVASFARLLPSGIRPLRH